MYAKLTGLYRLWTCLVYPIVTALDPATGITFEVPDVLSKGNSYIISWAPWDSEDDFMLGIGNDGHPDWYTGMMGVGNGSSNSGLYSWIVPDWSFEDTEHFFGLCWRNECGKSNDPNHLHRSSYVRIVNASSKSPASILSEAPGSLQSSTSATTLTPDTTTSRTSSITTLTTS